MPMLTADVPKELIDQLDKAAAEQSERLALGVSRSAIVRQALRHYLATFFTPERSIDGTIVTHKAADTDKAA